jgi:3-hydroxyisobutyrate dehydrogenase-like beta-hydroxyacid dehydrogenase
VTARRRDNGIRGRLIIEEPVMNMTIAVVAAGSMGSAVGERLSRRGAWVVTALQGRSETSRKRAQAAGMQPATDDELAAADLFLSIVPPDKATELATRMATIFKTVGKRPVYIDLNAICPETAAQVAGIVTSSGATFVDGGIIGGPPKDGRAGPVFYLSGPVGDAAKILEAYGLRSKILSGGIGAASALKMSYAGITKGLTALGTTMLLAADRAGVAEALRAELADSQSELLARFGKAIPDMLPKAYRWMPEMKEIEQFIGDRPEAAIFRGASDLYGQIAEDQAADAQLVPVLKRALGLS